MSTYLVTGSHSQNDSSGRTFAPGDLIEDLEPTPRNQRLVDAGIFSLVDGEPMTAGITEAAAKLAEESGVDLADVKGSGKNGRVVEADVEAVAKSNDETEGKDA